MADETINHARRGFLRGKIRPPAAPLRPPWAQPEAEFLKRCTRCSLCQSACPSHIVQLRNGFPELDFARGACSFCAACVQVCAPAALWRADLLAPPWPPAAPLKAQVGERCLGARGVECRICGEHCDADAIRFKPRLGGPPLPEILADACTGCGACVAPCPEKTITITRQAT